MSCLAIPNLSDGRNPGLIERLRASVQDAGCIVLDTHSDAVHNRTVFTVVSARPGEAERQAALVDAMTNLAQTAAAAIDLSQQSGVHPRVGALDVCPFVPLGSAIGPCVETARLAAQRIGQEAGLPVYLYGAAAKPTRPLELPDIRRGGLTGLTQRAASGFTPDHGPLEIDSRRGAVCVGARGVLIAFNVWLEGDADAARAIASAVRATNGGPPGLRALGLELEPGLVQVSMNLTQPDRTGIDAAFEAVKKQALALGPRIVKTEIVGLVPERYLPIGNGEAARLTDHPIVSLESKLKAAGLRPQPPDS